MDRTGRENSRATHLPIAKQQGEQGRGLWAVPPFNLDDFREVYGALPFHRDYKEHDYV